MYIYKYIYYISYIGTYRRIALLLADFEVVPDSVLDYFYPEQTVRYSVPKSEFSGIF